MGANYCKYDIYVLETMGYSSNEAKNLMFNGTEVYTEQDFKEFFHMYMKEWECNEEEIEAFKKMIKTGECPEDWFIVELDGILNYVNIVS